jgi:hypothetical protein
MSLASCSKSEKSNLDVLAEWRKNAPTTTAPATEGSASSVSLPMLPEGADPFAQENYRVAAIRSYSTARGHAMSLMELAGEFDLGSEAWASGMKDLASKFKSEATYFAKLNPPTQYVEKHQALVLSMSRVSDYIKELDAALVSGNFTQGAEALALIQDETNTMVQNGRFDEETNVTTTTITVP